MEVSGDSMSLGRLSLSRGPAAPDAHHHLLPQGKGSPKRNLVSMGLSEKVGILSPGPLAQARVHQ